VDDAPEIEKLVKSNVATQGITAEVTSYDLYEAKASLAENVFPDCSGPSKLYISGSSCEAANGATCDCEADGESCKCDCSWYTIVC